MKSDSNAAIDEVIARFFTVFDNRAGRVPEAHAFAMLFAANATLATHSREDVQITAPDAFVTPRIELLTSGLARIGEAWRIVSLAWVDDPAWGA